MIDDKKIEEAARYYCNNRYPASQDAPFIAEGFRHGAKWAVNELLKDLWHPASEKPLLRNGKCLVVYNSGKVDIFSISFVYEMLSNYGKNGMDWKYWAYVSDFIPKARR